MKITYFKTAMIINFILLTLISIKTDWTQIKETMDIIIYILIQLPFMFRWKKWDEQEAQK